jgi:hypothetical protein
MTVKEIIESQKICFFDKCRCTECPMYLIKEGNCQMNLAQATIDKLTELVELVDDKVNHHYYDTLEHYQEENTRLTEKLNSIYEILNKSQL